MATKILKSEYGEESSPDHVLDSNLETEQKSQNLMTEEENEGVFRQFETFRDEGESKKRNLTQGGGGESVEELKKYDRPSNEQSVPQEGYVSPKVSSKNDEYDDYAEDFEQEKELQDSKDDIPEDISETVNQTPIQDKTQASPSPKATPTTPQDIPKVENPSILNPTPKVETEISGKHTSRHSDSSVEEIELNPEVNLESQMPTNIVVGGGNFGEERRQTLHIEEGSDSEEKDNGTLNSDEETIDLNSEQGEPEYFKSIVNSQKEQVTKSNFLIKLEVQNRKVKKSEFKLKPIQKKRKSGSRKARKRGVVKAQTETESAFSSNLSGRGKPSGRRRRILAQASAGPANKTQISNLNNTAAHTNPFQRKLTKNRRKIGQKPGENSAQMRISTSSHKYSGVGASYGIQQRMQSLRNRKSLKSAQPQRKTQYQEYQRLKNKYDTSIDPQNEGMVSEESYFKNHSERPPKGVQRVTSGNLRRDRNAHLNGQHSGLTASNKALEKDIKNIKIVDYLSQSRPTKTPLNPAHTGYYTENGGGGNSMFNEGDQLKSSLIDVSKAYDYVTQAKSGKQMLNSDLPPRNAPDSVDLVSTNQLISKPNPGQKWSKILEYMRKNPQVLMQAIPSPRNQSKSPTNILNEENPHTKVQKIMQNFPDLNKMSNFSQGKEKSEREASLRDDRSLGSSHYSNYTRTSKHRNKHQKPKRPNPNSTKMVVIKPVPVPNQQTSIKKFRFKGIEQSDRSSTSKHKPTNPFRNISVEERKREQSLYTDIWDEESSQPQKLDFYQNPKREISECGSNGPESALDFMGKGGKKIGGLRAQTEKIFRIANKTETQDGPKLIDWKHSTLYTQYKEGLLTPYGSGDFESLYKEKDIQYITQMVTEMKQDVASAQILKPIFQKGLQTLKQLMEDLDMGTGFGKVMEKYKKVNVQNVLRILIRCKMYFAARREVLKMLENIENRETCLDNIRNVVLGMQEDQEIIARKAKIQELAEYLMKITQKLSKTMENFNKSFKQFGKTMIYDQMDYAKVITKEKKEMKEILEMFDIQLKKL